MKKILTMLIILLTIGISSIKGFCFSSTGTIVTFNYSEKYWDEQREKQYYQIIANDCKKSFLVISLISGMCVIFNVFEPLPIVVIGFGSLKRTIELHKILKRDKAKGNIK